jgi:hypothetical protein
MRGAIRPRKRQSAALAGTADHRSSMSRAIESRPELRLPDGVDGLAPLPGDPFDVVGRR